MSYYFSKTIDGPIDAAVDRVRQSLVAEGFGIIHEIDMAETFKKKIEVEFRPYRILGACNPQLAYEALQLEDKVGTMLPCNVIVQETDGGRIEVAAIDPVASMTAIENEKLKEAATQVRFKLKSAVDRL